MRLHGPVVTYEKDGVFCASYYDTNSNSNEVKNLLHKCNVREQMAEKLKEMLGKNNLDTKVSSINTNTLGYAVEEVSKMRFISKISNIQFTTGERLGEASNKE
jgi:hypothetical protein